MTARRVVVTGTSLVSPLGNDVAEIWQRWKSAVIKDKAEHPSQVDGCLRAHFELCKEVNQRFLRRADRFAALAVAASSDLLQAAAFTERNARESHCGVAIGSALGGANSIDEQHTRLRDRGPSRVSAFTIPMLMPNAASGHVAVLWKLRGPAKGVCAGNASATQSIGSAFHLIRDGITDAMICGGSESPAAYELLAAINHRVPAPEYDESTGFDSQTSESPRPKRTLAEAAGVLLLEELNFARRRGANILAEIRGYGQSFSAGRLADSPASSPTGSRKQTADCRQIAITNAMRSALTDADRKPSDVACVYSSGPGFDHDEDQEVQSMATVFDPSQTELVGSVSMDLGCNFLGANGAIDAILCVESIRRDKSENATSLQNSFCSSGHNACVVFDAFSSAP